MLTSLIKINKGTYTKGDKVICKWECHIFNIKVAIITHTTTEINIINKLTINKNKSNKIKSFNNEN